MDSSYGETYVFGLPVDDLLIDDFDRQLGSSDFVPELSPRPPSAEPVNTTEEHEHEDTDQKEKETITLSDYSNQDLQMLQKYISEKGLPSNTVALFVDCVFETDDGSAISAVMTAESGSQQLPIESVSQSPGIVQMQVFNGTTEIGLERGPVAGSTRNRRKSNMEVKQFMDDEMEFDNSPMAIEMEELEAEAQPNSPREQKPGKRMKIVKKGRVEKQKPVKQKKTKMHEEPLTAKNADAHKARARRVIKKEQWKKMETRVSTLEEENQQLREEYEQLREENDHFRQLLFL